MEFKRGASTSTNFGPEAKKLKSAIMLPDSATTESDNWSKTKSSSFCVCVCVCVSIFNKNTKQMIGPNIRDKLAALTDKIRTTKYCCRMNNCRNNKITNYLPTWRKLILTKTF